MSIWVWLTICRYDTNTVRFCSDAAISNQIGAAVNTRMPTAGTRGAGRKNAVDNRAGVFRVAGSL